MFIRFSNGCNFNNDDECDDVKSFLRNVVERSFNPNYVDSMKIFTHDLNDGPLVGDRGALLTAIDGLDCSSDRQNTDFGKAVANAPDTSEEKKLFIISFCSPSDSVNVPSILDPHNSEDIEILIFNGGSDIDAHFHVYYPKVQVIQIILVQMILMVKHYYQQLKKLKKNYVNVIHHHQHQVQFQYPHVILHQCQQMIQHHLQLIHHHHNLHQ